MPVAAGGGTVTSAGEEIGMRRGVDFTHVIMTRALIAGRADMTGGPGPRPDLFVVGDAKCGTTSLHRLFELAPGVGTPAPQGAALFLGPGAGRGR